MKKTILMFAVVLLVPGKASSRDTLNTQKSLYFELLGNGLLWSANFEQKVSPKLALRLGFGIFSISYDEILGNSNLVTFPLMVNYISGKGKNHFEAGTGLCGVNIKTEGTNEFNMDLTFVIGYRYQRSGKKGFVFRAGLCPYIPIVNPSQREAFVLPAVSFGFNF